MSFRFWQRIRRRLVSTAFLVAGLSGSITGFVTLRVSKAFAWWTLEKEFSVSYDTSQPGRRIPIADETLYMPDGLHPNDAGTHIMAMAFADLF